MQHTNWGRVIENFQLWFARFFILSGTAFLVGWRDWSGWWFTLSVFLILIEPTNAGVSALEQRVDRLEKREQSRTMREEIHVN